MRPRRSAVEIGFPSSATRVKAGASETIAGGEDQWQEAHTESSAAVRNNLTLPAMLRTKGFREVRRPCALSLPRNRRRPPQTQSASSQRGTSKETEPPPLRRDYRGRGSD